jgi:outer membrane receptor protein involved in Fe transport
MRPVLVFLVALSCLVFASPIVSAHGADAVAGATGAANGNTISGRVSDAHGNPVAAADVRIAELERRVLTDAGGVFRFSGVPSGRYTITVRRLSYAARAIVVEVRGDASLDFALDATPFVTEPVIVTGTPAPRQPGRLALSSSVLSGEALRQNETVSLAHAIEGLPGVHTMSTGAQVGKPVIRGLTGSRVLVLEDGHRLEDYSWSDEDGPSIDARSVERVEVIRGPASVLYGSDALNGVVNAVPADLPEPAGNQRVLHLGGAAYFGSNNSEAGASARVEGASGPWGWRVFGIGRRAGDLNTPDGELANTGFFAGTGDGAVSRRSDNGSATLRFTHYGGEFKLLEKEGPPSGEAEEGGPERKLADSRLQLGINHLFGNIRLEVRAQGQRHNLIEVADDPNAPPGEKKESEQFNLLLNTGTLDVVAHHGGSKWTGAFGVSGLAQSNDTRGPIPLVPDASVASGALYAFEQRRLGRVDVLAGARFDAIQLDADANAGLALAAQSRDYQQFSGNMGAVYNATKELSVGANVGQAWRAPTLFELFTNGPHLGELRYEIGDPDLDPEKGLDFDASLRWQNDRVRADVAAYRNQMSDFIFVRPTDEYHALASGDSLRVYEYRQSDAVLEGGELGVEVIAHGNLTLHGRFDYVWGQDEAGDEPLPLIPPAHGAVGFKLHWFNMGWADQAMLGAEVVGVAEQTRRSEFDTPTASYAMLHLDAGIERPWSGHGFRIDLSIRNLTNDSHRDYLSRYKEFADDQGRNVLLRVSTGL